MLISSDLLYSPLPCVKSPTMPLPARPRQPSENRSAHQILWDDDDDGEDDDNDDNDDDEDDEAAVLPLGINPLKIISMPDSLTKPAAS